MAGELAAGRTGDLTQRQKLAEHSPGISIASPCPRGGCAQARTVRRAMGSDGFPLHAGKLDQSGVCAWRAAAHTCADRHERASV